MMIDERTSKNILMIDKDGDDGVYADSIEDYWSEDKIGENSVSKLKRIVLRIIISKKWIFDC